MRNNTLYQKSLQYLQVFESSARPKLEFDESKAADFLANVFSLLQWSLPFFFWEDQNTKTECGKTIIFTHFLQVIKLYKNITYTIYFSCLQILHNKLEVLQFINRNKFKYLICLHVGISSINFRDGFLQQIFLGVKPRGMPCIMTWVMLFSHYF